ncbi:MAG: SDR family oxidoreductase [Cyanobacteria bacterium J069]
MKACVIGATGRTGRRIVAELVRREIPVRAVVRDVERGRQVLPAAAEVVAGDVLQPDSLRAAIADSTVVLCATGAAPSLDPTGPYRTDLEGTKNLVDICKEKDIQQFVLVSSLCVSKLFHPLNLFWLILVWKKQAEEYIQQSGLPYTIVRPGGLTDDDLPDAVVMQGADTLFDGRIPRQKVAEVCVEALTLPEARNKIVEVVARPDAPAQPYRELFAAIA